MLEQFTKQDVIDAASQGWVLCDVYDPLVNKWSLKVLPTEFSPTRGATEALSHVVAQAKFNNALCIKALRLITHFKYPK